jgi:hypothetical protein
MINSIQNARDVKLLKGREEGEKLWERLLFATVLVLFYLILAMTSMLFKLAPLTISMTIVVYYY